VGVEGQEKTVGPSPEPFIDDQEWHHVAVVRTCDPKVILELSDTKVYEP